ncbi:MAG: hypothetical protein HEQ20_05880 [Aphanizomenon flos-aquae KM1D3_PB]|nr:MAG: hypothetical protein HEQ20_05880 [Aphanizomenon flos-aquae KM1D3_PB]
MSLWQGKRQEARGKSEEGLGDFTFLYTVWFYCVHLLILIKINFYWKCHQFFFRHLFNKFIVKSVLLQILDYMSYDWI